MKIKNIPGKIKFLSQKYNAYFRNMVLNYTGKFKLLKKNKKVILGGTAKGWVSIDRYNNKANFKIHIDDNVNLNFIKDNSIDIFYSSHMFEHLSISTIKKILNIIYTKLKKGGIVRVVAPDALLFINEYKKNPKMFGKNHEYGVGTKRNYFQEIEMWMNKLNIDGERKKECMKPHNLLCSELVCYVDYPQYGHTFDKTIFEKKINGNLSEFIHWVESHYDKSRKSGHQTVLYPEKIKELLEASDFNVEILKYRLSNFKEVEMNPEIDLELRKNISFYVEGIKN